MREIKFRAWDGKKLHYPEIITIGVNGWNGEVSGSFQPAEWSGGYCTTAYIEQFTGLRDKNGVEIYEGDIRVGEWSCCAGCADPTRNRGTQTMEWLDDVAGLAWVGDDIPDWIDIKVVGNIHENPELLAPTPPAPSGG